MNPHKRDWRDDPMLGTKPSIIVAQLLSQLLERVRAARDLSEAIDALRPMDPSVFERAWVNELFVLLDGVIWMFDIIRMVHEREARSTGKPAKALPRSVREAEIRSIETDLKPARDKLGAHFFGALRGGLTVRDYFAVDVTQYDLKHEHDVVEDSIQELWKWHEKNRNLVETYVKANDLKGKRKRKK